LLKKNIKDMAECTIYDKLRYIAETKDLIKTAIETQDVEVLESDTFRKYAEYITEIRKVASVNGETGDITLKTINGYNLVGEGNIIIQGGEGGDIDLSDYYTKEQTYSKDEVDDLLENTGGGSEPEQYVKSVTTDNVGSIFINNNDGTSDRIVFPLINGQNIVNNGGNIETDLSDYYTKEETYSKDEVDGLLENTGEGGTAGVEAINIGQDIQDWTQKTGIVKLYTQMYDGGYEVAADGMSFFGIKPIDDSIIIENAGFTANGCFRGGIKVNPNVLGGGGGSVTAGVNKLILGEEDFGWNSYQGDVKLKSNFITFDEGDTGYDIGVSGEDVNGNESGSMWFGFRSTDGSLLLEDGGGRLDLKVNPDILGGSETDPIFTSWKNDDSIVIGKNAVNGATNFGILMEKSNVVVIGNNAKVQVDGGVAIGDGATVLNGAIGGVAIGPNISVDAAYTTNINNVLKGDATKNAYIRDRNGNYTKILDLINNAGGNVDLSDYYTKGEVYNKNEVNELIDGVTAGDVDLTNYYTKQEVDNKIPSLNGYATEQWVEDKNYLTEHQSLEDYAKKSDIPDVSKFIKEIPSEYITEEELNGKGYLTSIPDTYVTDGELSTAISDKVSQNALNEAIEGVENKIPSLDGYATEQWVEDKKYLTEHQSLEDYAKKSDIPTSNTAFTNDAGFITLNEVPPTDLSNYYTKTETYSKDEVDGLLENTGGGSGSVKVVELTQAEYDALQIKEEGVIYVITDAPDLKFKTINGESIIGDGDIKVQAEVDLTNYVTESELNEKGYITKIPSEYITESELNNSFKTINGESIIGNGNIEIEGGIGTITIKELTQAEYDALTSYDDTTFYVITDEKAQYYTKEEIDALIGGVSDKINNINEMI
jgi:hypothetical protein